MAELVGRPSGGSDFHGTNKNGIALGCGRGDLAVPREWLANLAARRDSFARL